MFRGIIYFRGKVGVWYFLKEIKKKFFLWSGYKKLFILFEFYCCLFVFFMKSKDFMLFFILRVEKKIFNVFLFLNIIFLCYQLRNFENCLIDLIDYFLENGVIIFNFIMLRMLN